MSRLEVAFADIDLLHAEDYPHGVRTPIERGRDKRCITTKGSFKIRQHLLIARSLDHISKRGAAITEYVSYHHHFIRRLRISRMRIRARQSRQSSFWIQTW